MRSPRPLSTQEKEALVRRLEAGERVAALAAETGGCTSRFASGGRPIGR
jgi:hypothetical protein